MHFQTSNIGIKMNKALKEYIITLGLVWLGCAVLFIFVFMFFLKPQFKAKKMLAKQFAEKKAEFENARDTLSEQSRADFEKELSMLREKVEGFVTDSDGTANLTFDISRIANANNVSSFSIKGRNNLEVKDIEGCSLIGRSRIDVDFESNFKQFAKFLNSLERHEPVIFIDSFSIDKNRQNAEKAKVAMTLSVFVQKRQGS